MLCPYCKNPAAPGVPSCLRCGMALEKVTQLFGVVPRIVEGISDDAGVLNEAAKRRIRSAANELSIRLPQINIAVVTARLPADTSLGVFAFWIFNAAGIARDISRGANNHDTLLTIDPTSGRASLMVGYGLEKFITESQLEGIVDTGRDDFERENFAGGIEKIIATLRQTLTDIVANLESTHGLAPIVQAKSTQVATEPSEF